MKFLHLPDQPGGEMARYRFIAQMVAPLPGDPSREVKMLVTASRWQKLMDEINGHIRADAARDDPFKIATSATLATPQNCRAFKFPPCLVVLNVGHNDQSICDIVNAEEEAKTPFRFREANFAVRGTNGAKIDPYAELNSSDPYMEELARRKAKRAGDRNASG